MGRLLKGVNFKGENSHIENGTVKYEILWVDSPAHPASLNRRADSRLDPYPTSNPMQLVEVGVKKGGFG